MLILERPYISEYLAETIINNDWLVLQNEAIRNLSIEERAFRRISSAKAKDIYENQYYPLIYSNSEEAISWVLEKLPKSSLADYIRLFKNKVAFRDMLKDFYPDFSYKSLTIEELKALSIEELKYPFVIKPSVGFLSLGAHIIGSDADWKILLNSIDEEAANIQRLYSRDIVDTSEFIFEDYVDGEEFAIDAYYDENGMPIILNIYQHPFLNAKDLKDRIYLMSVGIMVKYMSHFVLLLKKIGDKNDIKNFPFHMEVRITRDEKIIPIEVNPLRFAGWCCADVAKYVWGINVYECIMNKQKPDWNTILMNSKRGVYYFSIAEVPPALENNRIKSFDYVKYLSNYSNVLEFRQINYKKNPAFAVIFGQANDKNEIKQILELKTKDFVKYS